VAGDHFRARLADLLHGGNAPLALVQTDLDDLIGINERRGREAGDLALAAWERLLDGNLPAGAEVMRLGGDEYAVLLPGLSAESALVLLEEIREHYASHPVDGLGEATTASIGVAANPPHGATADALWQAADQALMRAKRDGRDRAAIYVEEKMVLKSNYYPRAGLDRLAKLSSATGRTEASLLREALDDLVGKYRESL
jgi:diguanylate cyclase (GGDEF)-like protein